MIRVEEIKKKNNIETKNPRNIVMIIISGEY